MAMVSTYGDFLAQKKKNEQIRATAGKLGTPVTGNPSTPGNPVTQAGGITGANGATGVNGAKYQNSGQIGYAEGLSKYYGIGNNGTGAQMSQPQSLGEALGGGNIVSAAKPVSGSTQRTSDSITRQNAMSSPVTYAEFGYGGGANAGATPKEQYGISYAEGFNLMERTGQRRLLSGTSGPQESQTTIDKASSGAADETGTGTLPGNQKLNLKLINGKTVWVTADNAENGVKPGEIPSGMYDEMSPNAKEAIEAKKTEITPAEPAEPTEPAGDMTYGEYLNKYYGGDAAKKNYDRAIENAKTDYARAKSTYGQRAETLGRAGLTGSGYGDYLEGLAYSEMQGAKRDAALTRDKQKAEQQRSYGEYLENKKNTLSQNYQNWLVTSANKTYDLDTLKGMLAEQVKNGDLTQAQADAIIDNYGKGSDAGSVEQRPAILSKLTAQIMDAGLTDKSKIRAAIAAYQGAYGVTLTEDEIAGIISNIQGITGKGNTGTGTGEDGETPPSETVAAAYNALLSTDANGSLIYGSASDEYLKHLLINSGYEAADAEEAIRRFRKTIEETKKSNTENYLKNLGIGSGKLILGNVLEQFAQQYGLNSEEYTKARTAIHSQNKELLGRILSDDFNVNTMEAKNMISNLLGDDYSAWDSLSDQEKWDTIKNAILNSDSSFDDNDTNDFLAKWYSKMTIKSLKNADLDEKQKLDVIANAIIGCANDSGNMASAACAKLRKELAEKLTVQYLTGKNGFIGGIYINGIKIDCEYGNSYLDKSAKKKLDNHRKGAEKNGGIAGYQGSVFVCDGTKINGDGNWKAVKIIGKFSDDQKQALLMLLSTTFSIGSAG